MAQNTPDIERDAEGYYVDEFGQSYGVCNACGTEVPAFSECCPDGEVELPDF